MRDAFTIHSSALPASTQLAGFHGSEGLSRLYSFEVFLVMTNHVGHDVDLERAVGARATLRLARSDGGPDSVINGIFAAIELVSDFAARSVFRAVLVPKLWHLTQSLHSRVFAGKTVPAILEAVLQSGGLSGDDCSLRLLGSYASQEHVCQYQESDFDFISRWMEREGLYYYFEQGDGAERLIITDTRSSHTPLGVRPVRYFPQSAGTPTPGDAFRAFTCRHTSLPASVRLKDYDYAKPALDVSGQAPVSPGGVGQISVHGARFFSPGEGARLAQVRAQALQAGSVVYHGIGAASNLRPGYTFDLDDHPRAAFNTSYLTTELEHWNNQLPGMPELEQLVPWDDEYRVEVTAVAANVQYRAPQRTPWPRIYGTEHAVIEGPSASNYAQIDAHGRYAVRFHFDEGDAGPGTASTWVRMLQPHGGGIEGFHFPLRAGTEVACSFAGGDPDRPSIVGVAPNALTPSPVGAGNNTRNVIQTGGRNRLEFEDEAGLERVTLSTPHANSYLRMGSPNDLFEVHLTTDKSAQLSTGANFAIEVGGNMTQHTVGTFDRFTGLNQSDTVQGDVVNNYQGTMTETIGGTMTETIGGTMTQTIGDTLTQTIGNPKAAGVTPPPDKAFTKPGTSAKSTVLKQEIYGHNEVYIDGHYKRTQTETLDVVRGNTSSQIDGDSKSTVEGFRYSFTKGKQESYVEGGIFNHVLGGTFSSIVGGQASTVVGGSVSATLGGTANFVAGGRVNGTMGWQCNLNVGAIVSSLVGINTISIAGGKFENIEGFKLEVTTGASSKFATVDAMVAKINLKSQDLTLTAGQVELTKQALSLQGCDVKIVA